MVIYFQLVLWFVAVCVALAMVAVGLFSAPWYVLLALLLGVLAAIRSLMPTTDEWGSFVDEDVSEPAITMDQEVRSSPDNSSPALRYRGAQYPNQVSADESSHTQAGSQVTAPAPAQNLKYRGAKVTESHD